MRTIRFPRVCCLLVTVLCCISSVSIAAETKIPKQVTAAKSIYLDNQTGEQATLDTASAEFTKWGRFTFAKSKDDADITAVFLLKNGMDKWGNLGFTEMDIYVKGEAAPVLHVRNAVHIIFDPQHRTKQCVAAFKKLLESKNQP